MRKTIHFAEHDADAEEVEHLRELVIQLRDNALGSGNMNWAVGLSHVIAFMAVAKENLFGDSPAAILLKKLFNAAVPFDAPVVPPQRGSIDDYEKFREIMREIRAFLPKESEP